MESLGRGLCVGGDALVCDRVQWGTGEYIHTVEFNAEEDPSPFHRSHVSVLHCFVLPSPTPLVSCTPCCTFCVLSLI